MGQRLTPTAQRPLFDTGRVEKDGVLDEENEGEAGTLEDADWDCTELEAVRVVRLRVCEGESDRDGV